MASWGKIFVIGVFVAGGVMMAAQWFPSRGTRSGPIVAVTAPATLSPQAEAGKVAFDANCAPCHGTNAAGTDRGPPFVHIIYNPGHHSDQVFFLAAKIGVRSHHWNFGDMPPQPQVSQQQLTDIVAYVRALQEANGIFYQSHRM
jgi:mono/diheme cytochrome c family protein